jgi:hypothetical protein
MNKATVNNQSRFTSLPPKKVAVALLARNFPEPRQNRGGQRQAGVAVEALGRSNKLS